MRTFVEVCDVFQVAVAAVDQGIDGRNARLLARSLMGETGKFADGLGNVGADGGADRGRGLVGRTSGLRPRDGFVAIASSEPATKKARKRNAPGPTATLQ